MSVPRMSHMPLLVAKTTMGARELSRALLFRGGEGQQSDLGGRIAEEWGG